MVIGVIVAIVIIVIFVIIGAQFAISAVQLQNETQVWEGLGIIIIGIVAGFVVGFLVEKYIG